MGYYEKQARALQEVESTLKKMQRNEKNMDFSEFLGEAQVNYPASMKAIRTHAETVIKKLGGAIFEGVIMWDWEQEPHTRDLVLGRIKPPFASKSGVEEPSLYDKLMEKQGP